MAGDNTYQYLAFGSAWDNCVSLITDGALYNLMDIPELDLKSEGFYTEANENFIINDRLYFAFSNYANAGGLPLYMVFNIDLLKQFDLPLPYDTILSGDWTMDVFEQYIKGVSSDLNGDGKIDGYDRHGLASGDLISGINTALNTALAGGGAAGDIVIPVYIGGDMIDEIVVTAQQRMNLRSGGR